MKDSVDGTTSPTKTAISVSVCDQAAAYGLINRIRDLGLTLLSAKRFNLDDSP
jgi:hypothetical protein